MESPVQPISEDTKRELRRMFKSCDVNGDGELSKKELEQCLFCVGICPTADDITFFMETFDKNGDGRLQIEELVENAHILHAHSLNRQELVSAFRLFDINKDGYIRNSELLQVLCHKDFMPVDEARQLLEYLRRHFDRDGDGKYNYAEFVEIFFSDNFQEQVVNRNK